jgi:pyruvate kinase
MTTKPQIGKNIFNQELTRGRQAAESLRKSLDELTDDPGPQTRALLIAKAALALSKIEAVLSALDTIGRNSKNGTNSTLKTE